MELRLGGAGQRKKHSAGRQRHQRTAAHHGPTITSPAPMFTKVLVANRGEIAIRVIRTLDELGVGSVAVYSEPDRDAPHVRRAGEAYLLGPGPAAESYLKVDKILEVAAAVRRRGDPPRLRLPGRERGVRAGLRGGRHRLHRPARERDRRDGLEDQGARADARRRRADRAGHDRPGRHRRGRQGRHRRVDRLPGGDQGGRRRRRQGLPGRRVRGRARGSAFEGAAREGEKFFSDATVYIERYLPDPRHVEVQILADGDGNVIHLFERDCSVQRRHQKLIEESPAPAVDPELRERIGKIGTDAARAVGYRSAGTIEGLLADGEYFFLEMNTRVQVEHCVTEMVTGHRHRARADQDRRRRAARLLAGGRGPARPRDRVPHQRRGRLQELRARARPHRVLPRARRAVRARRLRRRGGLRGPAAVRPDDRQADRLGRRPRGIDPADAARARRVRDRRAEDAGPVPPGAARHRPVAQRRDLPRPRSRTRTGSSSSTFPRRSRARAARRPRRSSASTPSRSRAASSTSR